MQNREKCDCRLINVKLIGRHSLYHKYNQQLETEMIRMKKSALGTRIHSLRKEKGITQEELGKAIGVTSQAVSKWEFSRDYLIWNRKYTNITLLY